MFKLQNWKNSIGWRWNPNYKVYAIRGWLEKYVIGCCGYKRGKSIGEIEGAILYI